MPLPDDIPGYDVDPGGDAAVYDEWAALAGEPAHPPHDHRQRDGRRLSDFLRRDRSDLDHDPDQGRFSPRIDPGAGGSGDRQDLDADRSGRPPRRRRRRPAPSRPRRHLHQQGRGGNGGPDPRRPRSGRRSPLARHVSWARGPPVARLSRSRLAARQFRHPRRRRRPPDSSPRHEGDEPRDRRRRRRQARPGQDRGRAHREIQGPPDDAESRGRPCREPDRRSEPSPCRDRRRRTDDGGESVPRISSAPAGSERGRLRRSSALADPRPGQ